MRCFDGVPFCMDPSTPLPSLFDRIMTPSRASPVVSESDLLPGYCNVTVGGVIEKFETLGGAIRSVGARDVGSRGGGGK